MKSEVRKGEEVATLSNRQIKRREAVTTETLRSGERKIGVTRRIGIRVGKG